jgi:hypothetical protein
MVDRVASGLRHGGRVPGAVEHGFLGRVEPHRRAQRPRDGRAQVTLRGRAG